MLDRFAWVDGHADIWAIFRDAAALRVVVHALAQPYATDNVTAVCGIESRGFLLGGAVAVQLGTGFVPIRKETGLFPGAKVSRVTAPDYRGHSHILRMQQSAVNPGDRLVLVDDWIETGSQVTAARDMISNCGAQLIGCSVIVDQMTDLLRHEIGRVNAVLRADELPPS